MLGVVREAGREQRGWWAAGCYIDSADAGCHQDMVL